MYNLVIDNKTLYDLECILGGYYYPLKTFMNKKDWISVCETMHLSDGNFFPLPINLCVDSDAVQHRELCLMDNTNYPLAKLVIDDKYQTDIDFECLQSYGTTDINHPYVKYKQQHKDKYYVSGILTQINKPRHYDFIEHRLTPFDTRNYFKDNNWKTVIGFQTRNPMHRAHFELTQYALNQTNDSEAKLFLNPVVGETQVDDIDYFIRVNCYKKILPYYKENQVLLGLLPLSMRMAGPREACLHALIRRNYGCTHFVVGRDHAGPSTKDKNGESFYDPYEAQTLFEKYADIIGIKPITSKMIVYNDTKKIYQEIDKVDKTDNILKLSGSELRKRLYNKQDIPLWYSYPEVLTLLQESYNKTGVCYYLIGLPCSGKTTYANMLKVKLQEKNPSQQITILDGDIVRTNLSKGLGFSQKDRSTNVRRIGYVASEIVKHNGIVICANIAPYEDDRLFNRNIIQKVGKYIEIWVNTPLNICETRDVKGLYKLARKGIIKQFTGISDPFEKPKHVDVVINNDDYNIESVII
jgi:sulfate adenylyltransferase